MAVRQLGAPPSRADDAATVAWVSAQLAQQILNHGSNANAIRPNAAGPVTWVGSVAPANAINGDVWYNTTGTVNPGPSMPSGLVANWSSNSLTALANGATVTTWTDSVGALGLTATGTPTYLAADKAVSYDGSTARHDATLAVAQPATSIILFRLPSGVTSVPILGSATAIHSLSTTSAGLLQVSSGTALARPGALVSGQWYMATYIANGASSSVRSGTDTPTTGNSGSNGRATVRVASNTTAASVGRVDVKAVLLFGRVLSDAEIADVKTILQNDHGLTL